MGPAAFEFQKMKSILDMAWYMRSEIVPCLIGPPGIGKTAAVIEHAKEHGCGKVVKIVASRCVPSETVGMTMPDSKHRSMDIYNSRQLSSLEDGDILFLDELLEADQFVLSTMLTLIESREQADGTPLPDIQIIAATNATVSSDQLKGNIKQRFMFARFGIDEDATREYILKKTGMYMDADVLRQLVADGSDYNFLTPRSLTKLCLWVDSIPEDELERWKAAVNWMWSSNIGTLICRARTERDSVILPPEEQIKKFVKNRRPDLAEQHDGFANCTMDDLLEILRNDPSWETFQLELLNETIETQEEEVDSIDF